MFLVVNIWLYELLSTLYMCYFCLNSLPEFEKITLLEV